MLFLQLWFKYIDYIVREEKSMWLYFKFKMGSILQKVLRLHGIVKWALYTHNL